MVEGVPNTSGIGPAARLTQAAGSAPKAKPAKANEIDSNDITQRSPGAAIKILLHRLGYKINGVTEATDSNGNVTITVEDARLFPNEINQLIQRFSESKYLIQFPPEVAGYGSWLVETLKDMKKDFPDAAGLIDKVIIELERDDIPGKDEGLTEKEMNALYELRGTMQTMYAGSQSTANNDKRYALERICACIKKTPGLSSDDQLKLRKLIGIMYATGPVLITEPFLLALMSGRQKTFTALDAEQQKVLDEALAVLTRLGCDISAISDYGMSKDTSILGLMSEWGKDLSISVKGERRATSYVPEGSIPVLKYILFYDDKVARLKYLAIRIWGEDGKSGLMLKMKDYRELTESQEWIDIIKTIVSVNQKIKDKIPITEQEAIEYEEAFRKKDALIAKYPAAVDFENSGNKELAMAMEEYYSTIAYLSSDEIDWEFLRRMEARFPKLLKAPVEINNPYRSITESHSAYDLIFKEGGWNSIEKRFKRGERWSTLNVVAGEGAPEENMLLAKEALATVINSINLTNENIDLSGPALYILGPKLLPGVLGAGAQMASILYSKRYRVNSGAPSQETLSDNSWLTRVLSKIGLTTATEANFNYGLSWKMILIQGADRPHQMLVDSFGEDAVRNKNLMGEPAINDIITFVEKFYLQLLSQPDAWQHMDFTKLNFRNFTSRSPALEQLRKLSELLKSKKGSFNLQEEYMQLELFVPDERTGKLVAAEGSAADIAEIKNGAQVLRDLLMDIYAIYGALGKTGIDMGDKAKLSRDPVVEAAFGVKGERVKIVVKGDTGGLRDAKVTSESSGLLRGTGEVLKHAWDTQIMYSYEMPWFAIPGGFFQTGMFAYKAARDGYRGVLNESFLSPWNTIAGTNYQLQTSDKEIRQAWDSWQKAKEYATQTYVTFLGFELLPYYPIKEALKRIYHGDVTRGTAELGVSAIFFRYALNRCMTTGGMVYRIASGQLPATAATFDALVQTQGLTTRYPLLAGKWLYNTNIWGLRQASRFAMDWTGRGVQGIYNAGSEALDLMPSVRTSLWRAGDWFTRYKEATAKPWLSSWTEPLRTRGESLPGAVKGVGKAVWENVAGSRGLERAAEFTQQELGRPLMKARKAFRAWRAGAPIAGYANEFEAVLREQALKPNLRNALADAIKGQLRGTPVSEALTAAKARGIVDMGRLELELAGDLWRSEIDDMARELSQAFMTGNRNFRATPRMLNLLDDVALKARASGKTGAELSEFVQKLMADAIGTSGEWQEVFKEMAKSRTQQMRQLAGQGGRIQDWFSRLTGRVTAGEDLYRSIRGLAPGQLPSIGNVAIRPEVMRAFIKNVMQGKTFSQFMQESAEAGMEISQAELGALGDAQPLFETMKGGQLQRLQQTLRVKFRLAGGALKQVGRALGAAGVGMLAADATDLAMDITGVKEGSKARKVGGVAAFVGGTAAGFASQSLTTAVGTPAAVLYGIGMGASGAAWVMKKRYGVGEYQSSIITRASERYVKQNGGWKNPVFWGKRFTDKIGMKTYSDVWYAATYAKFQYNQIEEEDKKRVQDFAGAVKKEVKAVIARYLGKKVSRMSAADMAKIKTAIKAALVNVVIKMGMDVLVQEQDFARFYKSGDNFVDLPDEVLDMDFSKFGSFQPSEKFVTWAMYSK